MLRGPIDNNIEQQIKDQLPDISDLVKAAPRLGSDLNAMRFAAEPNVPIAGVCLRDAIDTLEASWFAVYEALAHKFWYDQHAADFNNSASRSLWCQRFFADDAALRLYAVGEDLAEAIVFMLKIEKIDLDPYKQRYSSRQTIVGNYLRDQLPKHAVTQAAAQLILSAEWKWTRDYRDDWVHDQPPLMQDFGIQFTRTSRWKDVANAPSPQKMMGLGLGGDKPEFTVEQLVTNVVGAVAAASEATREIAKQFLQILKNKEDEDAGRWRAPDIKG